MVYLYKWICVILWEMVKERAGAAMMKDETKQNDNKKFGKIRTIIQSFLIFILIVLVILMMFDISNLQGTAKVINYSGLVRGATQRLMKLELTKNPNDDLMVYLDEILTGLKYGDKSYSLISLDDELYQDKLDELIKYWKNIKEKTLQLRTNAYDFKTMEELLEMSENYFAMTDEMVSAAEVYSEKIARRISVLEIMSAIDMFFLMIMVLNQAIAIVKVNKKNMLLEQKAYIDIHTGLKNKNMCEELLDSNIPIVNPTACIMFDLNNLKNTNDTLGHSAGDKLIADFAQALKKSVRHDDFVGRCGGDEFMIVLYGVDNDTIEGVLLRLQNEVKKYNELSTVIQISYAHGWAVSTEYNDCTLRLLFDAADRRMYANKQMMKCGEVR